MAENIVDAITVKRAEFKEFFNRTGTLRAFAAPEEIKRFRKENPKDFYLFGESREFPVSDFDRLPVKWLKNTKSHCNRVHLEAAPGEFLVFQIVLNSPGKIIAPKLRYEVSGLDTWTCFNLEGVDCLGNAFEKQMEIPPERVQPLWIGVQIPENAKGGFNGKIIVRTENLPEQELALGITVTGLVLKNGGEGDLMRLARLKWLNSRIGFDDNNVPAPFQPLKRNDREISLLNRKITLGTNGLPEKIETDFPVLDAPASLNVCMNGETIPFQFGELEIIRETPCGIEFRSRGKSDRGVALTATGKIEFDGYISVDFELQVEKMLDFDGISLKLNQTAEASEYLIGMGFQGGKTPERNDWKWNPENWQDGFWLGGVHGGLKLRLSGPEYRSPLVNCYYAFRQLNSPGLWDNNGAGGIRLEKENTGICRTNAFSGAFSMTPGENRRFHLEFWVTPLKTIDTKTHWNTRFYHPHMHSFQVGKPDPLECLDFESMRKTTANVVNIHHAVAFNPIINYPYSPLSFDALKAFVEKAHRHGVKVLLYYTVRELTVHCPEFWPFASMNEEIICPGPGKDARPLTNKNGPHPWLVQHLKKNFIPAWAEEIKSGPYAGCLDLSVLTTPDTRLENFYLEGLRYLLERCPIDGLYLDDSSLSRTGFQRLERIFRQYRGAAPLIDFHAWNPGVHGHVSVVYRDLHNLPYFTRLWLGESFNYETASPDYYLTELSGIPFGLMGEMLANGGNPWRGILYGMSSRFGWFGDPRALWNYWNEFKIASSRMIGYWEKECPVKTDAAEIKATCYLAPDRIVIAVASWAENEREFHLLLPESLTPGGTLHAPRIEGFQEEFTVSIHDALRLKPGKGVLLELPLENAAHTV